MNKKIVLLGILAFVTILLFTAETVLAWGYTYTYRTSSDYMRCLGIRCDRTERIAIRTPRFTTPTYSFGYGGGWVWRRQPTTCYQYVFE